jgi:hypothetical protein
MMSAIDRARIAQAIAEISGFMSKHHLDLDDLIHIGGEDLNSPDPRVAEKARRVEKTWALMARLGIKFTDLAQSTAQYPPSRPGMRVARVTFVK